MPKPAIPCRRQDAAQHEGSAMIRDIPSAQRSLGAPNPTGTPPLGPWDLVLCWPLGLGHSLPSSVYPNLPGNVETFEPASPESHKSAVVLLLHPLVVWWSVSSRLLVGHRSVGGRLMVGYRSVGGRLVVGLKRPTTSPASSQSSTKQAVMKNDPRQTDIQLN